MYVLRRVRAGALFRSLPVLSVVLLVALKSGLFDPADVEGDHRTPHEDPSPCQPCGKLSAARVYVTSNCCQYLNHRHLYVSTAATELASAVSHVNLQSCLERHLFDPLQVLLVGHSRVWQLFWALTSRVGARLRTRELPAHGVPYGGDPLPGQADWPLSTNATCVEVFRKPSSWWHQRPSCSWAADAPGLQLDMRWRDWVDRHLADIVSSAVQHRPPSLLVLAIGLKDTVRATPLLLARPQRLWRRLRELVVGGLSRLAESTETVLLLDFPANPNLLRTPYEKGTGSALVVANAAMYDIFGSVKGLHIWSSPFARVNSYYSATCRANGELLVPDAVTAHHCLNDTFHPGPEVVESMLDDLIRIIC